MRTYGWFCVGAVVLLAGLSSVLAKVEEAYFKVGGPLTLKPQHPENLTNIIWKFNNDLLGEWLYPMVELTFYRSFRGRTNLDVESGALTVTNMTADDVGTYVVELNGKVYDPSYQAIAIEEVRKPRITIAPLVCATRVECTATCEGKTEKAGPVTYKWWFGEKEMELENMTIRITRPETNQVETFTCQMKNAVSDKKSDPEKNPLFEPFDYGWIIGVVVVGVLAVVGAVFGYKYRTAILEFFSQFFGDGNTVSAEEMTSTRNGNAIVQPLMDKSAPGGQSSENATPGKDAATDVKS